MPIVCSYLRDQGLKYPKIATLVVVCPLSALIESHIQELANHGIAVCTLGDAGLLEDDIPKHFLFSQVQNLLFAKKSGKRCSIAKRFRKISLVWLRMRPM